MPATPFRAAPGPRGLPFAGSLWQVSTDILGFLSGIEERYGAVAQARLGHLRYHLVSDPELAEQVLRRRSERYSRESPTSEKLVDITGRSLLTTVGDPWRARRKLIAPFFARERMEAERPAMAGIARRHLARWAQPARRGEPIDATAAVMGLACAIASHVLFGAEVEDPELERALDGVLAHHWRRLKDPLQLAHRLPTRSRRAFDAGNRVVARIVDGIAGSGGDGALLAALREAETSGGIAVHDELITLLIAGHETTANALAWALHLLAGHPQAQEELRAEARAIDAASAEVPYAKRVFQEAMRLYPPIWLIERRALVEDDLAGFRIPAGSGVIVSPWVMHRARRYWDDPEKFRPERFRRSPPKHVYIPFGIGPHACVGANLALVEGPLLLSLIARDWRWRSAPRASVAPQPGLTLRMNRPLRLLVEAA